MHGCTTLSSHTQPITILLISGKLGHFRASLVAQLVKNLTAIQETQFNFWVGKIPWRRDRLPTPEFLGFPGGSDGKESACNVGDHSNILPEESPWTEEPGGLHSMGS